MVKKQKGYGSPVKVQRCVKLEKCKIASFFWLEKPASKPLHGTHKRDKKTHPSRFGGFETRNLARKNHRFFSEKNTRFLFFKDPRDTHLLGDDGRITEVFMEINDGYDGLGGGSCG